MKFVYESETLTRNRKNLTKQIKKQWMNYNPNLVWILWNSHMELICKLPISIYHNAGKLNNIIPIILINNSGPTFPQLLVMNNRSREMLWLKKWYLEKDYKYRTRCGRVGVGKRVGVRRLDHPKIVTANCSRLYQICTVKFRSWQGWCGSIINKWTWHARIQAVVAMRIPAVVGCNASYLIRCTIRFTRILAPSRPV